MYRTSFVGCAFHVPIRVGARGTLAGVARLRLRGWRWRATASARTACNVIRSVNPSELRVSVSFKKQLQVRGHLFSADRKTKDHLTLAHIADGAADAACRRHLATAHRKIYFWSAVDDAVALCRRRSGSAAAVPVVAAAAVLDGLDGLSSFAHDLLDDLMSQAGLSD